MDLKTDLLPSLKKISLYYKISPPSSLSWPRPLLLYKIYCNFSDDYKIHPCMMYYYCCYCYNDYEQKNKVCVLVFCEKKNEIIPKQKIEDEKKIKNNYEISVPVLIRWRRIFFCNDSTQETLKNCVLILLLPLPAFFNPWWHVPPRRKKHNTPKHTQITPIMYTHTV